MSKPTATKHWRQLIVGARRTGPPAATRGFIASLSLGLIALVMTATPVLVAPAATIAADRVNPISMAYCIDCVPFQFEDENGEPAGLIIDLWRLWSEKTGIEIDFRPGSWDETLRMVRNGEAAAHAGLFYNEERARYLEYGSYLTTTETNFFIKKGLPPVEDVEDLAAYRVGVLAGDYVEGFLKEKLPEGTVIGFESYDAIMNALRDGQLQVFAADSPTGIYHLQKSGLGFGFEYPKNKPLYRTDWRAATMKGDTDLIKTINLGLAMITEAERQEIERRWVAVEAKGFELSRRDIAILAIILTVAVVAGVVVWTISLNRQITVQTRALRAANQASAAAQTRLLDAIENLPAAFVLYDAAERLLLCNGKFRELYSYTDDEAVPGVDHGELFKLDVERGNIAADLDENVYFEQRVTLRREHEGTFEIQFVNGRWLRIHEHATSEGGLVSVQEDISDRKRADQKLEETEARLLDAIENVSDAFALYDSGDRLELCNGRFRDLYGYSEAEAAPGVDYGALHAIDIAHGYVSADVDEPTYLEQRMAYRARRQGTFEVQFRNGRWVQMRERATSAGGLVSIQADVTEQKRAERELAEKEAQFRLALDNMPGGIRLVDKDRRYVFFNARYSELYDFPEGLLKVGESTRVENLHQARRGDFGAGDPEALTDEWLGAYPVESEPTSWERTTPSGKILQVSTSPTPDGGVVNIVTDITERKRAEADMAAKESQLRIVLDNMPDGIRCFDKDNRFLFFNSRYSELWDLPDGLLKIGDFLGVENTYLAERGDYGDGDVEALVDSVMYALPFETEPQHYAQTTINGRVLDCRTRPTEDGGYVSIHSDITERKRAEEALRTAHAELRENEALFRQTARLANLGHWAWDEVEDRCTYCSEELARIHGITVDEYLAAKTSVESDLAQIHPDDREEYNQVTREWRNRDDTYDIEYRIVRPDGEVRHVRELAEAMRDEAGSLVRSIGSKQDITGQKKTEQAFREARDEADQANRAKSEFLATMSHEIRTPMNGVVGMIELLGQSRLDVDQRQMMSTARDSAFALLQIIDDILDFSKIEAGKLDIESLPLSLSDVVEGVADTLAPNAAIKDVDLSIFVDPAIPAGLLGDPVRLRQILFNLGGNAIKFSPHGRVTIRADLAAAESGAAKLRFEIVDTGIGISEAAQANLFEPFSQAESTTTRRFGGTGLGLSICRRLADMMGGGIGVESVEGEGSTFWFEVALPPGPAAKAGTAADFDLAELRVMIATPNVQDRQFFTSYLEHVGADVAAAPDGGQARKAARKAIGEGRPFDAAVIAQDIAEADGFALDEILARPGGDRSPSRAVVAYKRREEGQQERSRAAGFAAFITAPVRRDALLRAVSVVLGRASPAIEFEDEHAGLYDETAATAPTVEQARAAGRLILLAEDQPTNQQVLIRQLSLLGYAAEVVDDGELALAAWLAGDYALLLSDCHMPNMDGFELTRSIRSEEEGGGRRLPIIAVTANALQGEADRCLAAGMDDYLSKPVELATLKRMLAKWMPAVEGDIAGHAVTNADHPAADVSAGDGDGPIDFSVMRELVGDDPAFVLEMLKTFIRDNRKAHEQLSAALETHSASEVKDAAHKLKGMGRIIGARAMAERGESLQTAGSEENWPEIERLSPDMEEASRAAAAFAEDYMARNA